ncbi:uncharacterized protein K452DRAFT_245788 [Aplosporella prunicola CBS 121167]|uniref:Uncharacterized protein n=1 Tax=Aplosporella prunicola CBS 121167 TaxID=1176127 RepID=A0A6A6BKQ6_9PEZI|nr:uncharacterized protein K452DRAFT_245788 [Aplosporella prunicola CBS 121167]KAF2144712.1 hypothetical protein K452DRAFT_245788 [Aplosporella prunicola CBS 121167]
MDVDASDSPPFAARLDQAVKELGERVASQQRALDQLRASSREPLSQAPSSDPRARLQQLRLLKQAYERLTPLEPHLPGPVSVFPAILATRLVQQTVAEAKDAINSTRQKLNVTERHLESEEGSLRDADVLTESLTGRIENLQARGQENARRSPTQVATDIMNSTREQKRRYDAETGLLQEALDSFTKDHLAVMLAAEELGGPVVGDLMEIDEDMLAAGFSHQGKPKALKLGKSPSDSTRQRRIDEIWGQTDAVDGQPLDEKELAGEELHNLIRKLYDALVGDSGEGPYIELDRDSAAARFLVRAKVAQFHVRDARKLRLIDFGRELDD